MNNYFKALISHPLFSGSAIMIIGSNSVSFLSYLYHFAMAKMLTPSGYGELAALISLIGLLGIIPSSFSLVIIKYVSAAKDEKSVNNTIAWMQSKMVRVSIIFFVAILIASPAISSFLKISNTSYLILIALSFLFAFQSTFNRSILQGLLRFKETILSMLMENIGKLLISIFLVSVGFYVNGAIWAFVISAFFGLYITNYYLRSYRSKHNLISPPDVKSMLKFTLPVLVQSISITSIYSSDVILVKHFFSSHDAGIYAALSTLGKIIFFATGPIGAVMFPLVSKRYSKGFGYGKIFLYSFLVTMLLSLAAVLIYWLVPGLAINLLYGSLYLEASNLLVWFGIFMSLFSLSTLIIYYSLSLGDTKIVYAALIAAFIQIVAIWFYHSSIYQVVIISTVIMALLLSFLLIYLFLRKRTSLWK